MSAVAFAQPRLEGPLPGLVRRFRFAHDGTPQTDADDERPEQMYDEHVAQEGEHQRAFLLVAQRARNRRRARRHQRSVQ